MNKKTGLEYFPLDVDFFHDEKIQFVSARFGAKGEAITLRLLCKIYRHGYYTDWDEDAALLLAKGVVDVGQHSCARDVAHELVKRGFFDKGIFDSFGILTSRGIQKRFVEATKRRLGVKMRRELLLIDVSGFPHIVVESQNVNISSQNVDILKQSKVKYSKVKYKNICPPAGPADANVISKNSPNKDIEAAFDELWAKVPNKIGRIKARLEFGKAIKEGVPLEKIEAGLDAYNAHVTASAAEKRYIKTGGRWFAERYWENDYSVPAGKPKPKNSFHDFNQREYDWKEIERMERAYQNRVYGFDVDDEGGKG